MPAEPFIKVCGLTRRADALDAVEAGATALGFVFWPQSPRAVSPATARTIVAALPPGVLSVGVFVNETVAGIRAAVAASGVGMVQLHGDEPPSYAAALACPLMCACGIDEAEAAMAAWPGGVTLLVDARDPVRRGGTGRQVDWSRASLIARRRRIVLAGGLTPENVADAIRAVRPYGVDVSSGVEEAPGVKDAGKVARFVANARAALAAESEGAPEQGGSRS
jgi:phosphoribosylanthranilate isomerase